MGKSNSSEHKKFLMSFFDNVEGYEEKKVNGHWLVKQWDGHNNVWVVFLFSEVSFKKDNHIKSI